MNRVDKEIRKQMGLIKSTQDKKLRCQLAIKLYRELEQLDGEVTQSHIQYIPYDKAEEIKLLLLVNYIN